MIYNDRLIVEWIDSGGVVPSHSVNVNPASVDLSWSGRWKVAQRRGWSKLHNDETLELKPGRFYLLDTTEYVVMPEDVVGKLFLKSSAGRAGIEHLHAGYVDPGFEGTLTLEVELRVPWSIVIHRGQRIVQLTLETMVEPPLFPYRSVGRYNGQTVPTESKGF